MRRGPYGLYAQQGEADPADKKRKPRRTSLPKGMDGDGLTLEQALGLLSLPRIVGIHPERKEEIEAGLGRFGPFVRMGSIYGSLDPDDDVLVVGLNRAVDVLAKKLDSVRSLGPHPKDGEPVTVRKGRFGPYAQHGQRVANLPREAAMADVTLQEMVALLDERGKVLVKPGQKGKKAPVRKAANGAAPAGDAPAVRKPAVRKAATKEAAATKTSAKKGSARKAAAKKPGAKVGPKRAAAKPAKAPAV